MTARITKRQVVLELDSVRTSAKWLPDDRVQFTSDLDERVIPNTALRMMAADFRALGEPEQITVTIEPGDRLNDDEEFCPRCLAGVTSDEHHSECVVTGHAVDDEPTPTEGAAS